MNEHTPLTEKYLKSLEGMQEVPASPFFYTRLKGKMSPESTVSYFKPALAITLLMIFFCVNVYLSNSNKTGGSASSNPAQEFAKTYNLVTDLNY